MNKPSKIFENYETSVFKEIHQEAMNDYVRGYNDGAREQREILKKDLKTRLDPYLQAEQREKLIQILKDI